MKERSGVITMKGNPLVLLGEGIKVGSQRRMQHWRPMIYPR